tara:strand:- start:80 stop:334 length:255 start_codon:yes stop_codon:yes gene_type:complete
MTLNQAGKKEPMECKFQLQLLDICISKSWANPHLCAINHGLMSGSGRAKKPMMALSLEARSCCLEGARCFKIVYYFAVELMPAL